MTLKMTSAQAGVMSVNVSNNSSYQNYSNLDDHTQQTIYISLLMIYCDITVLLFKTVIIFIVVAVQWPGCGNTHVGRRLLVHPLISCPVIMLFP